MRYILKDYQADASTKLVKHLSDFADNYRRNGTVGAVGLAAITGAGKTVIAASVIEAILKGTGDEPADPSAVFLWVSDSEDLNEQSRWRIMQASSELDALTENITTSFREPKLRRGRVYFLNVQKLGKNSTLARQRYRVADPQQQMLGSMPAPDSGEVDLWRVIGNTIDDPDTTVYLIIDEAHRGMSSTKKASEERSTIVQTLMKGAPATALAEATPAMPIVLGISATIKRFNDVIAQSPGRVAVSVEVDPYKVQASGLVKDTITLHIPTEDGVYEEILLRSGTKSLMQFDHAWGGYVASQPDEKPVDPLMVVQVPNKVTDLQIEQYMSIIMDTWPALGVGAFAHVLGDKRSIPALGVLVDYVEPERIQDTREIRVVFAKEAISTGWDCPRAEVMVSFRPAKDLVHITQLLGRMLRTPLARSIDGNDFLNSTLCILPYFDRSNAVAVANKVAYGGTSFDESDPTTEKLRRVLINPVDLHPIEGEVADRVWECFESLPTDAVPKGTSNPIRLLQELAYELGVDGIVEDPKKTAFKSLCLALDYQYADNEDLVKDVEHDIWNLEAEYLQFRLGIANENSKTKVRSAEHGEEVTYRADANVVREAAKKAGRTFSPELVTKYVSYRKQQDASGRDLVEVFQEAQVRIAALARVEKTRDAVLGKATEIIHQWQEQFRVEMKILPETRLAKYEEIFEKTDVPTRMVLRKPANAQAETMMSQVDSFGKTVGEPVAIPLFEGHVLVDERNLYPAILNDLENTVVETEMARQESVAWLRNRSSGAGSFTIGYRNAVGDWSSLHPDFLFFSEVGGAVRASIVDPHSHHLADALPKLHGLVRFYEIDPGAWWRVEALTDLGQGDIRGIDLTKQTVRDAIRNAQSAEELYRDEGLSFKYAT
ncbi:Type III restriction enzyme, res subunit [Corynebacterium kalinowskii]|uniref:Type III restriction enzyme, res subunit n=1 Tax=Corynebacterium kalinowskii TaxID=2675216 RepID=A0A6B8VF01_9CORY|nr:DEAD/DEAH box helicase family protein [Corynebacterium kalinowskii]QGU01629.1 Type III restriction enzyme, res subunit [Corynebacterium kalinowskii]